MSSFTINYQKHKMKMIVMGSNKNIQGCFHLYLLYKRSPLRTAEHDCREINKILFNSDSLLVLLWPTIVVKLCHSLSLAPRSRTSALQFIHSSVYFSRSQQRHRFLSSMEKTHSGQCVLEVQNYVNECRSAYRKSLAYEFALSSHTFGG